MYSSLRPYQLDICRRVREAWRVHGSVLVQMPTGTGKTRVLASLVDEGTGVEDEKQCVWIVAHRRELVEQIEETVARCGMAKYDGRVMVMSIQWLSRHWGDVEGEPGLIVIDEAHHALAETYRELWARYPDAKKLGMTATPCRMDRRGFTALFDVLIASDGIADFILQGWLSAFDYVSIRADGDDQRLIDSLRKRGADGDYQVKEMDAVLNRRPGIGRLYESVRQYAAGKKGIVYAVSIGHARNIAAYYNDRGVNSVAIDSRTPSKVRKRLVDGFRQGKIRVLVNVDVFSEGFDCPDVEFVQLARPTLSLSKYLQQVGRGLRKTAGKESCVLIDNVGLYRLFGLPTAERDWQAMFEGRLAGKGVPATHAVAPAAGSARVHSSAMGCGRGCDLEVVMPHGKLLESLSTCSARPAVAGTGVALSGFRDRLSGLYGLRRGGLVTAVPQYAGVLGTDGNLAAVRLAGGSAVVVSDSGYVECALGQCRSVRFLGDNLLFVRGGDGRESYFDLLCGHRYTEKPKVMTIGDVQLLVVGGTAFSRTRVRYEAGAVRLGRSVSDYGYCLRIYDFLSSPKVRQVCVDDAEWGHASVCLFSGDSETYYHFSGLLADGSLVVADTAGRYFLARDGEAKRLIAIENPASPSEAFDVVIPRLQAEASARAAVRDAASCKSAELRRKSRLAELRGAVPFRSGLKWGLRLGGRVIVPPVYRSIGNPVGVYCAVEARPCQWGVMMLDGRMVVDARYMAVEINDNGTAMLTLIPGKTETVRLAP